MNAIKSGLIYIDIDCEIGVVMHVICASCIPAFGPVMLAGGFKYGEENG
jgi:hypothetical protein